jgi:methionyl-tRNA formyltransferase
MNLSTVPRLIFAGTADFAATILAALQIAGYPIVAVYTQPDRPAGRGRHLHASPVKQLAQQYDLPIHQPQNLNDLAVQEQLRFHKADIMIVAAYGLILSEAVLKIPRWGCVNVHGSLLPRWRGAAPIAHAILAGDKETGISIMQMDKGCDTGAVFTMSRCPIQEDDNQQMLHDRLAELGAKTLVAVLPNILLGKQVALPQGKQGACYAHKLTKQHACLDWQQSAIQLARAVRAYYAWPVAYSLLNTKTIRIWKARALQQQSGQAAGTIIAVSADGIDVSCGEGVLRLQQLQCPGGTVLPATDILHSKSSDFAPGKRFHL